MTSIRDNNISCEMLASTISTQHQPNLSQDLLLSLPIIRHSKTSAEEEAPIKCIRSKRPYSVNNHQITWTLMSSSNLRSSLSNLCPGKETPTVILEINDLNDLCLFNKKKNNQEQKEREEEEKRRKDTEVAKRSNNVEIEKEDIIFHDSHEQVSTMAMPPGNLHDIMNGINMGKEDEDEEERFPMKKHGGCSKFLTKRSAHKVSSLEPATTNKSIVFSNKKIPHIYEHKRIILESAIMLKEEFPFEQFTKSPVSLLSNAQMVYPHLTLR
jgi:hypothetical protein